MWSGQGRVPADERSSPVRGAVLFVVLFGTLILGACREGETLETTSDRAGNLETTSEQQHGTSEDPIDSTGTAAEPESTSPEAGDCPIRDGQPFLDGATVDLVEIGEADGVKVEGAVYPHPDYEGNPWSQWGQGYAVADGRFFSAIGDHIGRDGNSYIYEYDPSTGQLQMIGDVLSFVEHEPGSWGYGKIHGQMSPGPCGEIYLSTYWGSFRDLEFGGSYSGDVLMRLDPFDRTLSTLGVPVDRHGQASLASSPAHGLVYGEAVDPIVRADGSEGPFFVYDVESENLVYEAPENHEGYRNMIVDHEGRAYYSVGGRRLAVYDPETNEVREHPAEMPGDWLRASTPPAPDGRIFGVARDPDRFFIMYESGEIEDLGEAAGYTASMALGATGDHFYYMPHAHGSAWEDGAPLIRVDGESGDQEVVVRLNPLVEETLGYTVGGTYNVAAAPDGNTIYMGVNASPLGDDGGFGEVLLLVVHLP